MTLKELLSGHSLEDLPKEDQDNIFVLLERISRFRDIYGLPMRVTSGYRSIEDHIRIYQAINVPLSKVPLGSKHLRGAAVDIYDGNGLLMKYCKSNSHLLEDIGLWCEDKDPRPRVHFQIYPPSSGLRFFIP